MNILTFDIESWLEASLEILPKNYNVTKEQSDYFDSFAEQDTLLILSLLKKFNVRATFFVLGTMAKKYPELVRKLAADGHEVASHGLNHACVYKGTQEEFRADISESIEILQSITGKKVLGYRAPYFSITKNSLWALDILKSCGLKYDSSIFPFERGSLYGIKDAPRFPFPVRDGLWEVPLSTVRIMRYNVPVAGGGYFRLLPYWFIRACIKKINSLFHPAVIYMHPYEINPEELRRVFPGEASRFKFVKYLQNYGRHTIGRKMEMLLKEFKFTSVDNFLTNKYGR